MAIHFKRLLCLEFVDYCWRQYYSPVGNYSLQEVAKLKLQIPCNRK